MKYPKVFITGVTGQDGAYLAKSLVDKNYEVFGSMRRGASIKTYRLEELKIIDKIKLIPMELTELSNVMYELGNIRPDYIYNLASQSFVKDSFTHPHYTTSINYLGVLNILETVRLLKLDVKYFQASTCDMYGNCISTEQNEETPFNPISPYAISKLAAHYLVKNYRIAYNIHATTGILFNHESEFRGKEFVTRKISSWLSEIKKGKKDAIPLGSLNSSRDWGYAPEYVNAMQLIINEDNPDDYVVSTNTNYTVKQFLEWCCNELNYDVEFVGSGVNEECYDKKTGLKIAYVDKKYFRPSDVKNMLGSFKKINKNLNWAPKIFAKDIAKIMINYDYKK